MLIYSVKSYRTHLAGLIYDITMLFTQKVYWLMACVQGRVVTSSALITLYGDLLKWWSFDASSGCGYQYYAMHQNTLLSIIQP